MEKKIALSINEMKYLESLGLDTSDASMCWVIENNYEDSDFYLDISDEYDLTHPNVIPAYTLQDLMKKITNWSNHLLISFAYYDEGIACILSTENDNTLHTYSASIYNNETDIDSAYHMLLWCIENHYVITNKV